MAAGILLALGSALFTGAVDDGGQADGGDAGQPIAYIAAS
jgi:hypothetical protein